MKILKTKTNFEDDRGVIRDIFTHTNVDAMTYITFKKDVVRGNHYHNRTNQYDYVLEGKLLCRTQDDENSKIEESVVEVGDFITHNFPSRHAYKAIEDSTILSCTNGPRQGDAYEDDTIRLEGSRKLF